MSVRPDQIVWGSMRMLEKGRPKRFWIDFLRTLHKKRVSKIHSSYEYESFPLLCEVLDDLQSEGIRFQHVVKLAEPHFDRDRFDQSQFDSKLDLYLNSLKTERLDTVQWVWRGDVKREAEQISSFRSARNSMKASFDRKHIKQRISRLMCFPYSPAFGSVVLEEKWCAGLIVYLNRRELDYLGLCKRAIDLRKYIVALRPFFGGKVLDNKRIEADAALRWVLRQPGVTATVATFSTTEHIPELAA